MKDTVTKTYFPDYRTGKITYREVVDSDQVLHKRNAFPYFKDRQDAVDWVWKILEFRCEQLKHEYQQTVEALVALIHQG